MQRPLESRRKMLTLETGSIFHLLMFKCLFHIEMTPTSLWCPRGPASRYTTLISVSVDLHGTSFRYEEAHPACSAGCTFDHLHPSVKSRHATVIWWMKNCTVGGISWPESTYLSKVYSLSALKKYTWDLNWSLKTYSLWMLSDSSGVLTV